MTKANIRMLEEEQTDAPLLVQPFLRNLLIRNEVACLSGDDGDGDGHDARSNRSTNLAGDVMAFQIHLLFLKVIVMMTVMSSCLSHQ